MINFRGKLTSLSVVGLLRLWVGEVFLISGILPNIIQNPLPGPSEGEGIGFAGV